MDGLDANIQGDNLLCIALQFKISILNSKTS